MEILKQRCGRYKEVYSASQIREETLEVIVPDTNPDYEREICTFATAAVTDRSILSSSLRISGDLKACTFYDSQASESMYAINAETKFSYSFDVPSAMPDDSLCVSVRVLNACTEIMNSRKIRIKVKLDCCINVFRMENIELSEDACGLTGEGINVKTENIGQTNCIDIADKNISFTEEIILSDDEIAVLSRIIRSNCQWKSEEIKILQNKVMVRGVAKLTVYGWLDSAGKVDSREYVLPFSQVVECRNVCETDTVEVLYTNDGCYAKIIAKDDGGTCLRCEARADASVFVYRKSEGKLLLDLYSTEYEADVTEEKVYIENGTNEYSTKVSAQGKAEANDGVNRIIDSCVHTSYSCSGGTCRLRFYTSVLYEDGLGKLRTARTVIDADSDMPDNTVCSSVACALEGVTVSNEGSAIAVSVQAQITCRIKNGCTYSQVTGCTLDTSAKRNKNTKGNLVLRYPEKDESIWTIAKQYGTTQAAIMAANDIEDEAQLSCGKLIIIPFVK